MNLYNFSLSNYNNQYVVVPDSETIENGTVLRSQPICTIKNPYIWSYKNGYIQHTPSGKYISAMGDGIVNLTLQNKLENTNHQMFEINHKTGRIYKKGTDYVFDFTGGGALT